MKCPICDVELGDRRRCTNYWCRRDDRAFDDVWAVAEHRGRLRWAIASTKYRGDHRWVGWLGGLVAGFLLDHAPMFDDIDLIVGAPSNVGKARPADHVVEILRTVDAAVGDLWPTDARCPVLIKRAETTPMVTAATAASRRLWAAGELRAALVVTEPAAVAGRRVLAFDDVFTDGSTMREVARALRLSGAASFSVLVLARQPLRPPSLG
jgi:predicted amidophosphoribosyltransferase